jgi:hypothetical protein
MTKRTDVRLLLAGLAAAAGLAACGGGASTPSPAPNVLTLSGTAATGNALAGTIDVKCASGTPQSTSSGADGRFTVNITGGVLPCAVRVTGPAPGNLVLHSLAQGSGTSATVNITPVSEMMVARIAGQSPANFFAAFNPAKVTAAAIADAEQAVAPLLTQVKASSGSNIAALHPLTDPLVAKVSGSSTAGNDFDKLLDDLSAALSAAGTPLASVVQSVASNSTGSASGAAAATNHLLRPAASSCSALRSGSYRFVVPSSYTTQSFVVGIDAANLIGTSSDGATSTVAAVADSPCEFDNLSNGRFYVAKSGVLVQNQLEIGGARSIRFGFPEQTLPVTDLAGTWNFVEFGRDSLTSPFIFRHGYVVIDSAGKAYPTRCGTGLAGCTAPIGFAQVATAAGGGFTFTDDLASTGSSHVSRAYAYRDAQGDMALVLLTNSNGWVIGTKQSPRALPPVGFVSNFWDMAVLANNSVGTATTSSVSVTAVNTAASSYSRIKPSDGRLDSIAINNPRTGMNYRAASSGTYTAGPDTGRTYSVSSVIFMPVSNMGLTVYGTVDRTDSTGFFGISITRP